MYDISMALAWSELQHPQKSPRPVLAPEDKLDWDEWAQRAALRRTVLTMFEIAWAFSVMHEYELAFHCYEVGFMQAPDAKHFWQADTFEKWKSEYERDAAIWKDGPFLLQELFPIPLGQEFHPRVKQFAQDVDEFGMLLLMKGQYILIPGSRS